MSDPVADEKTRHRLMRRATQAAVLTAGTLIVIKLLAWIATGSLAMLASLVDSCLDVAASLVNMMAVRQALQPADAEHRFGHGKAESVAGLAQAAFIGGSAVFLVLESAERFVSPVVVNHEGIGIGVMLVSMTLTAVLVLYQRYVVRQTQSLAISADSAHYVGDILVNASVILALVCHMVFGWNWLDSVFAIAIAIYLARNAWGIAQESLNQLMDREMSEDERSRILDLCFSQPGALAVHDLRTRVSGPHSFIQLHLEVDSTLPLGSAHAIADRVETTIQDAFQSAEVIVHLDPFGVEEVETNPIARERVLAPQLRASLASLQNGEDSFSGK